MIQDPALVPYDTNGDADYISYPVISMGPRSTSRKGTAVGATPPGGSASPQYNLSFSQQRTKAGRDRGLLRLEYSSVNTEGTRRSAAVALTLDTDPNDPNLVTARRMLLGQLYNLLAQTDTDAANSIGFSELDGSMLSQFAGGEA
jgi:hypothetical protein